MLGSTCTVCGTALDGWPDDDMTCADCERRNFAGDALRTYGGPRVRGLGNGLPVRRRVRAWCWQCRTRLEDGVVQCPDHPQAGAWIAMENETDAS